MTPVPLRSHRLQTLRTVLWQEVSHSAAQAELVKKRSGSTGAGSQLVQTLFVTAEIGALSLLVAKREKYWSFILLKEAGKADNGTTKELCSSCVHLLSTLASDLL
ncbi:putative ATPase [Giardia duodenalis assemblage B]|uniref:Putative ATPase n=2 Tax=Giardia intestinalis TaxID=5741 RepID=A0A132NWQ5_GIAIN|nr:putative ATPase [Giardia intestinalis assemblage B]